jgi:hypothetical protein
MCKKKHNMKKHYSNPQCYVRKVIVHFEKEKKNPCVKQKQCEETL